MTAYHKIQLIKRLADEGVESEEKLTDIMLTAIWGVVTMDDPDPDPEPAKTVVADHVSMQAATVVYEPLAATRAASTSDKSPSMEELLIYRRSGMDPAVGAMRDRTWLSTQSSRDAISKMVDELGLKTEQEDARRVRNAESLFRSFCELLALAKKLNSVAPGCMAPEDDAVIHRAEDACTAPIRF